MSNQEIEHIQELRRIPQSIEKILSEMERDLHDDPEAMAFIDIVRGYTAIMSEAAEAIAAELLKTDKTFQSEPRVKRSSGKL